MAKRKEGEVLPTCLLWTHSSNTKGLHPVKLRVIHQRVVRYYPVFCADKEKLFLSRKNYDLISTTDKKKLRLEGRKLREVIDNTEALAKDAIRKSTNSGKDEFTFPQFERAYLGEESGANFLKHFKNHLDSLEKKQAGTHRCYQTVYNSFNDFLNHRDIDPASLTVERLYDYDKWLRQKTVGSKKKGQARRLSDTTISIHMRCLRTIYNRIAINDEFLKRKYPFSQVDYDEKYKIPVGFGQKGQTLTEKELINFVKARKFNGEPIPENPVYRAKQMFLFSFYGQGMNFKDIALLRYQNISRDGIEFERQKTIRTRRVPVKVRIPLTEELREILIEQGNPNKGNKSNFVFGVFDSSKTYTEKEKDGKVLQWVKTTNKWLKKYCELNGLPVVTTYASRHSFASMAKSHLPLAMISQMLGHSKITTTQAYLGRFEDAENRTGLMKVFKGIKKQSA